MSTNKRFLIPAFICVDADSVDAAEEAAQRLQAPSLQQVTGARLYLDETLKTAEIPPIVDGDPQTDPHSVFDVDALRISSGDARIALAAIEARIDGAFDHPALTGVGPLQADVLSDVRRIIAMARHQTLPPPPRVVHVFPDAAPAERIMAVFVKQYEDSRSGGTILPAGDVDFDATADVLALSLEEIQDLETDDELRDQIGLEHVTHDGPFEVELSDEVRKFFGVEALEDITQQMLDEKRGAYGVEVPEALRP